MTFRRRSKIPGLEPESNKEIIAIQDEIVQTIATLRGESVGITTDSKASTYNARYNEFIRCNPPAAGIDITFPIANPTAQNRWIWILKTAGGDVRIRSAGGKMQGSTAVLTLTTNALYIFQSDGLDSWWTTNAGSSGGGGSGTDPRIFAWFGV
jgi:hypothetical protein